MVVVKTAHGLSMSALLRNTSIDNYCSAYSISRITLGLCGYNKSSYPTRPDPRVTGQVGFTAGSP